MPNDGPHSTHPAPACYAAPMTGRNNNNNNQPADTIDLQDFLKLQGLVQTGGEAKFRVQGGEVLLNGEVETRRRKKLRRGDVVEYAGHTLKVDW